MGTVTNFKLAGECPPAVLEEVSLTGKTLLRIGTRGATDSCHVAQTLTAAREVCALLHGAAQKALLAATAAEENA